jgi:phenylalanyl-tRNA synthetase alpha chain
MCSFFYLGQILLHFHIRPEVSLPQSDRWHSHGQFHNKYNGWAFGFGDRLAMIKMGIPDIRILWSNDPRITSQFKDINSQFKEVSKFPATVRDISFIIDKSINLNNYYEIVRDYANDLIEEVKLLDEYENEAKFGQDKKSYTFRIVYRSSERTLTNEEINKIQEEIRKKTEQELGAVLR